MTRIKINIERCKGCGLCIIACPIGNIRISEKLNASGRRCAEIIDFEKCTGCALCCRMCPDVAIEIEAGEKTHLTKDRKSRHG